jgi:hypothetical protein
MAGFIKRALVHGSAMATAPCARDAGISGGRGVGRRRQAPLALDDPARPLPRIIRGRLPGKPGEHPASGLVQSAAGPGRRPAARS